MNYTNLEGKQGCKFLEGRGLRERILRFLSWLQFLFLDLSDGHMGIYF